MLMKFGVVKSSGRSVSVIPESEENRGDFIHRHNVVELGNHQYGPTYNSRNVH